MPIWAEKSQIQQFLFLNSKSTLSTNRIANFVYQNVIFRVVIFHQSVKLSAIIYIHKSFKKYVLPFISIFLHFACIQMLSLHLSASISVINNLYYKGISEFINPSSLVQFSSSLPTIWDYIYKAWGLFCGPIYALFKYCLKIPLRQYWFLTIMFIALIGVRHSIERVNSA